MAIPFYEFAFLSGSAMEIGEMLLDFLGKGISTGLWHRWITENQVTVEWFGVGT